MIGKAVAADPGVGAVAGASWIATILASVSDVAVQILGVPLPVVLAALAAACTARAYLPPAGFLKASLRVLGWTVLGCALAPLAQAVAGKFLGLVLPTNALAGVATIVASAEAWPSLIRWARSEGLFTRFLGGKGGNDGAA